MTSRELVRRTLEFDAPPRIPRQMWVLPWATERYPERVAALQARFPDDVVSAPAFLRSELPTRGERYVAGTFVDEWGCTFQSVQSGIIGEVKQPLLTDWSLLDTVRIPEERLSVDAAQVNAFCRQTQRFVVAGTCPRPFERLQFLRGTPNLLMDLMRRPPELASLLQRMHEFYLKELAVWAATDVDALFVMDDWGAQHAMLVAPKIWRELFQPLYAEYAALAHSHGKYLFMHSDGHILDILPELAELGVDALNCQVACMGIATVGETAAGRLTFWGEMDRQHLLPRGTREEVRDAVRQMRAALYRDGGVIAQCEFGPGANPDNIQAAFEAWEQV
ncbi:MAG: methyltransferase [Planctomycetes bacterium]|nr:methyltransferase [Planctomycetota bacterium]